MLTEPEVEQLVREQLQLPKRKKIVTYKSILWGNILTDSADLFKDDGNRLFFVERFVVIIKDARKPFHMKIETVDDCLREGI